MKILRRISFGHPVLRLQARQLSRQEILSDEIQQLIRDMFYTLDKRKYGVGLAAPQVGRSFALTVIHIQPMPWRPNVEETTLVVINPNVVATVGRRTGMWEGCISFCGGQKEFPCAKALRYKKVRVRYEDEHGKRHEKEFSGLVAHVLQHEIDHLNGVLFVDRVRDTKTFITVGEYNKRYRPKAR